MAIICYDGSMQQVRTKYGVFTRSMPRVVVEQAARSLNLRWDFMQLVAVKYKGPDACRSLRMTNGNIVAMLKDTINFVPLSIVYKLHSLKEFEIIPEEEALPDLPPELRPLGSPRIPWTTQSRIRRTGPIDISSVGDRKDGSHGTLSSKSSTTRYRLGVFVARPQGYVSGGYYHVWMTANVLCKFFDVTIVVPAMPIEYVKLAKHPELKIVLDTNYLLDLGYSPFDMIMSLHGTCGEAAAKFSTRYSVPVYLHCFEPGNLVLAKQPGQDRHFNDRAWGFRRELYKRVDYVVTSNPYCQEWTKQWIGEDPRKIVACVPPLNFKIADGVPEQDEKHEVVFISRMVDYKRPMDVLEVVQRVDRNLAVNFIGTHSSLSKRVSDVAQREKIRINFYTAITEEEKFRIIKRSKFMIFPTAFEGYGLPPAEALYCNKPCVAYDIPILRENYKDVLEFAKNRDTLDLCAKAKRLLDDPEYRRQRGIEGHSFIKNRLSFEACENTYIPIMPPVRVSFLIIVFEGADYLRECLTQLYPHAWEILVAEGAVQLMADHKGYYRSQDGTSEILDTFPDPEKKIKIFKIENRPWKDKAEMKHVLLKASEGHLLWQVDHDEFYKHDDMDMVVQEFVDDASLDLIEVYTHHFWKDYSRYRMDGKWGQVKFTRIWRKRGQLTWTYHDCPHRDGKPYRGTNFKGKNIGRILYHYGYVREEESVFDKIEFMSMRDVERNKAYHKEYNEWLEGKGKDIREFDGEHPKAIQERLNEGSLSPDNSRAVALG